MEIFNGIEHYEKFHTGYKTMVIKGLTHLIDIIPKTSRASAWNRHSWADHLKSLIETIEKHLKSDDPKSKSCVIGSLTTQMNYLLETKRINKKERVEVSEQIFLTFDVFKRDLEILSFEDYCQINILTSSMNIDNVRDWNVITKQIKEIQEKGLN